MRLGLDRFRQRNVEIENEKEKFDRRQEDVCHVFAQPTAAGASWSKKFFDVGRT